MSNELFELCKQVYGATGWKDAEAWWQWSLPDGEPYIAYPELERRWGLFGTQDAKGRCPLYTSDYLLEKLPNSYKRGVLAVAKTKDDTFKASYGLVSHRPIGYEFLLDTDGDTPLKALLKLTLKLHEEGLL